MVNLDFEQINKKTINGLYRTMYLKLCGLITCAPKPLRERASEIFDDINRHKLTEWEYTKQYWKECTTMCKSLIPDGL